MFGFFKKKNNENGLIGFEPDDNWKKVVIKGINQYDSLTFPERIWFNIRGIIDSTNNGGLISYYYNSGAENVYDAIDGLKSIGFENIADIIQKYNKILFKGSIVPKDLEERNGFINELDEQTDDLLQILEIDLTKAIDELEKQLEIYLKQEKLIK
jgi:hypothetical protein